MNRDERVLDENCIEDIYDTTRNGSSGDNSEWPNGDVEHSCLHCVVKAETRVEVLVACKGVGEKNKK